MSQTTPSPPPQQAARFNPWTVVAGICMILMDATWLTPWLRAFGPETAHTPNSTVFAYFTITLGVSYLLAKSLTDFNLMKNIRWGATVGYYGIIWLVGYSLLLTPLSLDEATKSAATLTYLGDITKLIPGEVLLTIFCLWVVWRGVQMAQQGTGTFAVLRFLKMGAVAFVAFGFLMQKTAADILGLELFVLFLFSALLGLAAARISLLGKLRGGRRNPFDRRWAAGVLGSVAAVVGTATTLAAVLSGRFMDFYRHVFTLLITAYIGLMLAPFLFIMGLFSSANIEQIPTPTPTPGPALPPWELENLGPINAVEVMSERGALLPPWLRPIFYWGSTIIAIAILVLILWRISYATQRRGRWEPVEYVYKSGDLLAQVRKSAKKQAQNLRGEGALGRLRQRQRLAAATRVRRVYTQLMDLCEAIDQPRPPAQTPLEFLPALKTIFPARGADLATITNAYLKVRYGELPETRAEIQAVEDAWARLQAEGEQKRKLAEIRRKEEARRRKEMESKA